MNFFSPRLVLLALAASLFAAPSLQAQFSPGPNPINGPVSAAQTLSSGTGTVAATGSLTVSGSNNSVTLSGGTAGSPVTLNNSGTISQTGTGRAIRSTVAGSNLIIQNFAGATISAAGNDTIAIGSGSVNSISVALTNAGTITGNNGNQAVNFGNLTSGTNSLTNSGRITASLADAVRPGTNGTITNTGTIMSTAANGSGSDGIDAQTNTGVQITNSSAGASTDSMIEGGRHGITGGNTSAAVNNGAFTMSITNYARGTIQGDNGAGINLDGINGNEVVTIVNHGTITGNGSSVASGSAAQDGDGVDVDGGVNLTNTGTIRSLNAIGDTSEGVTVGGGTINNSGTIQGSVANGNTSGAVGRGITIAGVDKDANGNAIPVQAPYAATTIINSGTIKGDSDSAIAFTSALTSGFSHTITNGAGGVIEGGGATAAAIQLGPDNDTINNAGTIKADSSNIAIDMGGGNNTLNITGGSASIIGNVSGGVGGTNALSITPGSGNTFSYAGSFSNFAAVQINAGTTVLSADSVYTGTTTVANGGVLVAHNNAAGGGSATGTGAVSVQSGSTLAGNGRIAGPVTIAAGGRVSPSNGGAFTPGTLTLGSDLNVTSGSRFALALGANTAGSDRVMIAGVLNFTGPGQLIFDVLNSGLSTGTYDVIDFASSSGLTLSNLAFGDTPAGFSGSFMLTGNSIEITVTSVPEPGTIQWLVAASVLGFASAFWRARRRSLRA